MAGIKPLPPNRQPYDLVIIGAGSGGIVAAQFAARVGARVALIERHRIGGDCTWTGCVPSKALIKVARTAHAARTAEQFGLSATLAPVDLGRVMTYVRNAVQTVYAGETPDVLKSRGVDVHIAHAKFSDAHSIELSSQTADAKGVLRGKKFLICTGGHAKIPPIPGLDAIPYYTNETVFEIESLPSHLLILGGGPIGCEMAQAFRRLGSRVTLIQAGDRLLPKDEPEASAVVQRVFEREGITVKLNTRITSARHDGTSIVLQHNSGSILGDAILLAVGRRPNVDSLSLANAGVRFSDAGIDVDDNLRTNVRHIFAAGDVTGGPQFTHLAGHQAFVAARNALYPGSSKGIVRTPPWSTFTSPEVARAGASEAEARLRFGQTIRVRMLPMHAVDRAITEGDTAGFIKVILTKKGVVVGATIVAERAGEAIQEWALAVHHGWPLSTIASTIHPYPTYGIGNQQLAFDYATEQFMSSATAKLLNRFSGR